MSTISFSTEDDIVKDFKKWAKAAKKSQSDIFRDMVTEYRFNQELDYFAAKNEQIMTELGIATEAELYEYLESGQTYEDRIRQQRLSRGE